MGWDCSPSSNVPACLCPSVPRNANLTQHATAPIFTLPDVLGAVFSSSQTDPESTRPYLDFGPRRKLPAPRLGLVLFQSGLLSSTRALSLSPSLVRDSLFASLSPLWSFFLNCSASPPISSATHHSSPTPDRHSLFYLLQPVSFTRDILLACLLRHQQSSCVAFFAPD